VQNTSYRIVGGDAAVDEVEVAGLAGGLVPGLEEVGGEVRRRRRRADAHVREERVLERHGLSLHGCSSVL
jgi:hypothetical protein